MRLLRTACMAMLGCSFMVAPNANAQVAPFKHNQPVTHGLPGKSINLEKAVRESDLIVTAIQIFPGMLFPTSAGQASYEEAKFKVTKVLKGSCGNEIVARVVVRGLPADAREDSLNVDSEYVLMIREDLDKRSKAFKVLPADQGSIAAVTAALSAQQKK